MVGEVIKRCCDKFVELKNIGGLEYCRLLEVIDEYGDRIWKICSFFWGF